MTDPYQNAVAQRDRMEQRIRKLEQRLAAARKSYEVANQFINSWELFAGDGSASASRKGSSWPDSGGESAAAATPKNPPKEEIAERAVKIVLKHGVPMSRAEIYAALKAEGVELHGKNPAVVLSTMLWRMKDVIPFIQDVGYWPVGVPLPSHIAGGHTPVAEHDPDVADYNALFDD